MINQHKSVWTITNHYQLSLINHNNQPSTYSHYSSNEGLKSCFTTNQSNNHTNHAWSCESIDALFQPKSLMWTLWGSKLHSNKAKTMIDFDSLPLFDATFVARCMGIDIFIGLICFPTKRANPVYLREWHQQIVTNILDTLPDLSCSQHIGASIHH